MLQIVKILLFVTVNVAGYFVIPLILGFLFKYDLYPNLSHDAKEAFQDWLMGGGVWAWIAAAAASVGYFFVQGELRTWLILAPLYVPFIFGMSVVLYFTYVPLGY